MHSLHQLNNIPPPIPGPSASLHQRAATSSPFVLHQPPSSAALLRRNSDAPLPSSLNNMLDDPFNPSRFIPKPARARPTHPSPSSPSKKRQYGDRFIPSRQDGLDLSTTFQLMQDPPSTPTRGNGSSKPVVAAVTDIEKDEARRTFTHLLKAETFGCDSPAEQVHGSPSHSRQGSAGPSSAPGTPRKTGPKLFSFGSPSRRERTNLDSPSHPRYSTSPITFESQRLLVSPRKQTRTLSKVPFKVLDAPELADDYYLNLVDWSSTNVLAVGLGAQVYLWSAATSAVTRLVDVSVAGGAGEHVTSLAWIGRGNVLAVGTEAGKVEIWDTQAGRRVRTMEGHGGRIGCMDWFDYTLTTGSRDRTIVHRDVRAPEHWVARLGAHKQEVCGLKWSSAGQLASGGNDNRLLIWESRAANSTPLFRFNEHTAAIKALSWSPHQNGLLASGGGSADKRIRFWNTLNGKLLNQIDTGSQVCSLKWSKNSNELVSTHGFSPGPIQNQVCLWKYPSMQQIATLSGHTYRVLYLAMSPDGETIVTGAGDETLRFWHAFPKKHKSSSLTSGTGSGGCGALGVSETGNGGLGSAFVGGGGFGSKGGMGFGQQGSAGGGGGGGGGLLNLFAQMR